MTRYPGGASARTRNLLLDDLPAEALEALRLQLEPVDLPVRTVLEHPYEVVEHVHFITRGVASRVAEAALSRLEIGIVGPEGMTGLSVFLGSGSSPHRVFMQADGAALRMNADALREAVDALPAFRDVLLKWAHLSLVHASMTALATSHLTIEQRLARWLLMLQDRLGSPILQTTHEFLSLMLGVQRPGVTLALHALEGASLIRSERGRVTVLDREALIDLAGDAYGVAEAEGRRLFGC